VRRDLAPGLLRVVRDDQPKVPAGYARLRRVFAERAELGEIAVDERLHRTGADVTVTETSGARYGGGPEASDPERRPRLLYRHRREPRAVDLEVLAVKRDRLAFPEAADDLEPFIHASRAVLAGDAEPRELL